MSNILERGGRRREQILASATQLFVEQGYEATSLRDIASSVGITHPGLLYHFHTKEDLLIEVLTRKDKRDYKLFFASVAQDDGLAVFKAYLAKLNADLSRRGMMELFLHMSVQAGNLDHQAHNFFLQRMQRRQECGTNAVAAMQDSRQLKMPVDPNKLARSVLACIDGLKQQWIYEPESVDVVKEVVQMCNFFLAEPLDENTNWAAYAESLNSLESHNDADTDSVPQDI